MPSFLQSAVDKYLTVLMQWSKLFVSQTKCIVSGAAYVTHKVLCISSVRTDCTACQEEPWYVTVWMALLSRLMIIILILRPQFTELSLLVCFLRLCEIITKQLEATIRWLLLNQSNWNLDWPTFNLQVLAFHIKTIFFHFSLFVDLVFTSWLYPSCASGPWW